MEKGRLGIESAPVDSAFADYRCAQDFACAHASGCRNKRDTSGKWVVCLFVFVILEDATSFLDLADFTGFVSLASSEDSAPSRFNVRSIESVLCTGSSTVAEES